jgi:hypothetical protein
MELSNPEVTDGPFCDACCTRLLGESRTPTELRHPLLQNTGSHILEFVNQHPSTDEGPNVRLVPDLPIPIMKQIRAKMTKHTNAVMPVIAGLKKKVTK